MIHRSLAQPLLLAFCILAISQGQALAAEKISEKKLAAIKELMEITGAEASSAQFSQLFTKQMLSILRANNPNISEQAVQIVTEEVTRLVGEELKSGSLQSQIHPIYARHFTLEDLQGLIEFNQSAVGQKANKVMPVLMEESLNAARSWSEKIGPKMSERVLNRFRQEGIIVRRAE